MDKIFFNGFKISGVHGVFPEERNIEQEFEVSITATLDTRQAAKSDALSDTADYLLFRKITEEVVKGESCYLIETLAEKIATKVLEDNKVTEVSVTIRKPSVLPNGIPGLTITRSR